MKWLSRLLTSGDALKSTPKVPWASLLNRQDVLILDTETTGVSNWSEVVDIALIDTCGSVLYDRLVLPQGNIPRVASNVHGLTRENLQEFGAKPWPNHHASLVAALRRASVLLAFNLRFDLRVIDQTAQQCHVLADMPSGASLPSLDARCVMLEYAAWRKVPHGWRKGHWKLHSLQAAFGREVTSRTKQDHRALADCQMTLALMRAVAKRDPGAGATLR
ncbi:MAG: 3'-5' exonuclease [Acidobacteriia bacterium]|nr:3'-5' exonuclease [Terriglobia bacterium]MYG01392.1 3'-5' exonuclease [Terriglobia bacterium]MYK09553.1 3'-5' exonuclease [Terriglobia bacterium]